MRPDNDNEIDTAGNPFRGLAWAIVLAVPVWIGGALLMMWLFRTVGETP